ncbi:hypothetical protein HDK90DRAFT_489519 [Phyllosticta capitalensis]|uniref:Uncharacterized protein n=1 Tax=Phyllosticta capitalensis TaxID=121624 RepID=A0ABR1YL13_9PEZI
MDPSNLTSNDRIVTYLGDQNLPNNSSLAPLSQGPYPEKAGSSYTTMEHGTGRQSPNDLGGDDYDMLSESVAVSDDEADTISSSDFANVGPTSEDVCSVVGTDTSTEDNLSGDEEEVEPVFQPSDSNTTTRADIRDPSDSVFYDPVHADVKQQDEGNKEELVLTLDDHFDYSSRGRSGPFRLGSFAKLHFGAARSPMTWAGPFCIKFTGLPLNPDLAASIKDCIRKKIASALDAGRPDIDYEPKRLAVVRIPGSDIELVPTSEIYMVPEDPTADDSSPDLEVVFHDATNQEWTAPETDAPTLHLTFDVTTNAQHERFQPAKGALCLVVGGSQETCTIPASLDAFLDLHPIYLNRHLASIGLDKSQKEPRSLKDILMEIYELEDKTTVLRRQFVESARDAWANRRTHFKTLGLVMLGLFLFYASAMMKERLLSGNLEPQKPSPTTSDATALSSAIDAFSGRSATPDWTSAVPAVKPNKDLIAAKDAEKSTRIEPMVHPFSPKANESDEFKIHVIGDHHFVLTPPKGWASLKKPPVLVISVLRGNQKIRHEHDQLVDGVYAVSIESHEAFGILDVSISTTSKPRIQQTLKVDFRSSWLKMLRWTSMTEKALGMVKSDVAVAQSNAKNTSLQFLKGLEVFKGTTKNATEDAVKSLAVVGERALQLFDQGVARALRRTVEAVDEERALVQVAADAVMELKESAKENIRKARANAVAITNTLSKKFQRGKAMPFHELKKKIKQDRLRAKEKARRASRARERRQTKP